MGDRHEEQRAALAALTDDELAGRIAELEQALPTAKAAAAAVEAEEKALPAALAAAYRAGAAGKAADLQARRYALPWERLQTQIQVQEAAIALGLAHWEVFNRQYTAARVALAAADDEVATAKERQKTAALVVYQAEGRRDAWRGRIRSAESGFWKLNEDLRRLEKNTGAVRS